MSCPSRLGRLVAPPALPFPRRGTFSSCAVVTWCSAVWPRGWDDVGKNKVVFSIPFCAVILRCLRHVPQVS